jgi:hypothetical protein
LEWTIDSPPSVHNFEKIPYVSAEAYTYPPETAEETDPEESGRKEKRPEDEHRRQEDE